MAATGTMGQRSFLPGDVFIFDDIFADVDSGDENDFDGFSDIMEDAELEPVNNLDDFWFDNANWNEGDREPYPLPFETRPGINKPIPENPQVIDYFNLFIDNDSYAEMARQTNLYAEQYLSSNNLKPHSRFQKWTPTSGPEMKLYISVCLAMALVSQKAVQEYWTTNEVTSTPFFKNVISRDRFLLLSSFFHLNDNSQYVRRGQEGHKPLHKLGKVFEELVNNFATTYTPHQKLSLDEGMVPWRGNLSFRMYNPDKPAKFGIKMYLLCDATSGYCLKLQVYTGKKNQAIPSSHGITYDLVMDLMRGYFGQGHILYCDRYFTSPQLFWDLWYLGVGATGTVNKNRKGIPQLIKDKKLENKGETAVMNNGPMTVTKYRDHNDVYILSTTEKSDNIALDKHDPATGQVIHRPAVVHSYNCFMGGVDRADQMVSYNHPVGTIKWWKKLFFHILNLAVMNSYIIYKESTSDRPPMLQRIFRRTLISDLVEAAAVPGSARGRPMSVRVERLHGRHFPGKGPSRGCHVCNNAKLRQENGSRNRHGRQTSYMCTRCNVPLCVVPCFEIFHTKQDFVSAYRSWKLHEE